MLLDLSVTEMDESLSEFSFSLVYDCVYLWQPKITGRRIIFSLCGAFFIIPGTCKVGFLLAVVVFLFKICILSTSDPTFNHLKPMYCSTLISVRSIVSISGLWLRLLLLLFVCCCMYVKAHYLAQMLFSIAVDLDVLCKGHQAYMS